MKNTETASEETKPSSKYIGFATYLNTRVTPVYGSNDIEKLLLMVEKSMNEIPKLGNLSFVIEPNLRIEAPDGFESYDEYVKYWEGYYAKMQKEQNLENDA